MKKTVLLLLLICLLASCTAQASPTPTATPPLTHTPTVVIPTATPTSIPVGTVAYYRIRVDYETTSDWSTLTFSNAEKILTMRTVEVRGDPTFQEAATTKWRLNQPLAASEAGKAMGMVVDYALTPESSSVPFQIHVEKGNSGNSTLRIYAIVNGEPSLLQSFEHAGDVANDAGQNPKDFSIDLTSLQKTPLLIGRVQKASRPKMVWAFYYPWYSSNDWLRPVLKDHPLTPYSSKDRATIERQVQEAQSAGIDGFISSWWGSGTETDQNLRTLLEVAREKDFKVSIYFETLSGPGEKPLDETHLHDELAYVIRQYGADPAFMQVDGKPLIVLWASRTVPLGTWKRVFTSLRAEGLDAVYLGMGYNPGNLDVFDGLHDYGIFDDPNLQQTYQSTARAVRYYSLLSETPTSKIWVATVQPGHDDELLPGREGKVQERLNGDVYRSTWDAAIQSNPDWIFITSWNEWWEHTYIEPGELYGDQYLKITKEYADAWKSK